MSSTGPTRRVLIPSALQSYTGASLVAAQGDTLGDVLDDLDRRYPGLRFRVVDEQDQLRRHMRVFVEGQAVRALAEALPTGAQVNLVLALSGG